MESRVGTVDLKGGVCKSLQVDSCGRLRLAALSANGSEGAYVSPVQDMGKAGTILADWIAQWTTPQRWEKFAGNPVYGPHQTGAWDDWCNGVSIIRNADNATYKMYYAGRKGAGIGFAEARMEEPTVWKEHPASPVITPRADDWEGDMINQPRVVKVTESHWRMYYTGWGFPGQGTTWAMGLAESHDAGVT